jgi:hypothetical protein
MCKYQVVKNIHLKVSSFDSNLYLWVEGEWGAGIDEWAMERSGKLIKMVVRYKLHYLRQGYSPNMATLYSLCPKRCESPLNTVRNSRENKKKIFRERRDSKEQHQRACSERA